MVVISSANGLSGGGTGSASYVRPNPHGFHDASNAGHMSTNNPYPQQQQQQLSSNAVESFQQQAGVVLTPKPHPFTGAVLPPKHARELTPTLVVSVTAVLADAVLVKGKSPYHGGDFSGAGRANQHLSQPQHFSPHHYSTHPSHRSQMSDSSIGHLLQTNVSDIFNFSQKNQLLLPLQTAQQDELLSTGCVQYTVWITEAWRILGWAEPSAALFWEMATMYHTLFFASRVVPLHEQQPPPPPGANKSMLDQGAKDGTTSHLSSSNNHPSHQSYLNSPRQQSHGGLSSIPPILSCGSTGSVDSQATNANNSSRSGPPSPNQTGGKGSSSHHHHSQHHPHNNQGGSHNKASAASAKELPVWLVAFFLLLHTEEHAHARNVSGDDERRFDSGSGTAAGFRGGNNAGGMIGNKLSSSPPSASSLSSGKSPFGLEHRGSATDRNSPTSVNGKINSGAGALGPRTRLHATTEYDVLHRYLASFLEKHIRKLLLFCAIPQNPEATSALHNMVALSRNYARQQQQQHSAPGSIPGKNGMDDSAKSQTDLLEDDANLSFSDVGKDVTLCAMDVERLNFILQRPLGGVMNDAPLSVSEVLLEGNNGGASEFGNHPQGARPTPPSSSGAASENSQNRYTRQVPLPFVEEQLRRHLRAFDGALNVESSSKPSSGVGLVDHLDEQVAAAMASLSIVSAPPSAPTASSVQNANISYSYRDRLPKELLYSGVRGTTILLKPRKHNHSSNNVSTNSSGFPGLGPSASFDSPDFQLYNGQDPPSRLHDVTIVNCSDTHLYLLQPFEHVTIAACTDCTIVLGAVAGLLHIQDCERMRITSTARRIAVSNSLEVVQYCFTPSPPLLVGDNRSCQLAPYNTYYDGLREDLLATGLAAAVMRGDGPVVLGGSSGGGNMGTSTSSADAVAHLGTSGILKYAALTCASNKWKVPVELGKLEVPSLSLPGSSMTQNSPPNPGADDSATGTKRGGEHITDDAMATPVLLPASEFHILFIPLESEAMRMRRMQSQSNAVIATNGPGAANAGATDDADDRTNDGADAANSSTGSGSTTPAGTQNSSGGTKEEESQYCRNLSDILHHSPFRLPLEYERRIHLVAERVRTLHCSTRSDDMTQEQQAHVEEEMNKKFRDWLVTSGNLRQVLDLVRMEREQVL